MKAWQIFLFVLFLVAILGLIVYQSVVWYSYPCEAWKSGWLSQAYAPGRCVS